MFAWGRVQHGVVIQNGSTRRVAFSLPHFTSFHTESSPQPHLGLLSELSSLNCTSTVQCSTLYNIRENRSVAVFYLKSAKCDQLPSTSMQL